MKRRLLSAFSGAVIFLLSSIVVAHWYAIVPIENPTQATEQTIGDVTTTTRWYCVSDTSGAIEGPWSEARLGESICGQLVAADGQTRYLEERIYDSRTVTTETRTRRYEITGSTQIRVGDALAQLPILGGGSGGGTSTPGGGAGDWQLGAGQFVTANMTANIIYPRPDNETNGWARNRRAPSAIAWSIPIVVQGGAPPFHCELDTGPTGSTIGQDLPTDWIANGLQDYCIVSWSSPTIGTHSFTVSVYDQDSGAATAVDTVSWQLEVIDREDSDYFCFVDAVSGSDSTGDGSYSAPFQTFDGWYNNSKTDATNAQEQCFYFTGTYAVSATLIGGNDDQVDMTLNKPPVHIGVPGESPIWDLEDTAWFDFESGEDVTIADLSLANPQAFDNGAPQAYRKTFIRLQQNPCERSLIFRNSFDGGGDTESVDGSNSAGIFCSETMLIHQYAAIVQNTFFDMDNMDLALWYNTYDVVAEGNRITGSYGGTHNPSWGFFAKGGFTSPSIRRFSIRFNVGTSASLARPLVHISITTPQDKGEIEVQYNIYRATHTGASDEQGCFAVGQGTVQGAADWLDVWIQRNNCFSPYTTLAAFDSGGPIEYELNAWEHDGTNGGLGTNVDGLVEYGGDLSATRTNDDLAATSGVLDDTTLLLEGANRTTYCGLRGAELAFTC